MNTNPNNHHSQFELFNEHKGKKSSELSSTGWFFRGLAFSPENVVVFFIIIIVSFVVLFSFGVERGKRVAMLSLDGEVVSSEKKAVQNEKNSVLLHSSDLNEKTVNKEIDGVKGTSVGERKISDNEKILKLVKRKNLSENIFTIQVASFKSEKSAKVEADKLNGIGEDVFVLPKGNYSIVCVGRFSAKTEAETFSSKIKNKYNDFYIRRL